MRIAFPDLKAKILSALLVCPHLLIGALVFGISRRIFHAVGLPQQPIWTRTLAALAGAFIVVVLFPRRTVLAYTAQRTKLSGIQIAYVGQTGSGTVLLVALITAILAVATAVGFPRSPDSRAH